LPPLPRGEKEESFMEGLQKSSPPFEKGRTGGIYEPLFQKTKLIRNLHFAMKFSVPFQNAKLIP
jgi:hypothetical protein